MKSRIAPISFTLAMTVAMLFAAPVEVLWYDGKSSGGWELDNENPLPVYDATAMGWLQSS